jgi:hypothetical protein
MVNGEGDRRPHFLIEDRGKAERFTSPKSGRSTGNVPPRNRAQHAAHLRAQLAAIRADGAEDAEDGLGLQIEFRGFAGIDLATESLADDRSGIELLNSRQDGNTLFATVYVPAGKLARFEKYIAAYVEERVNRKGDPIDHRKLIDAIRDIRLATIRALWTDAPELLPNAGNVPISWEVWLPVRQNRTQVLERFRNLAELVGLTASERVLEFPERTVLVCTGTQTQLEQSVELLSLIAELRRAKETAEFFDSMAVNEQAIWAQELSRRTLAAPANAPFACVLDTGVNRGHMLLAHSLHADDMHTVEPAWTTADEHGHGTEMAGVAIYGDIVTQLVSDGPVHLACRLESVKIIREGGENDTTVYGAVIQEGVNRVEVTSPDRTRVFSLAVTATDSRDRGRPSSWSSTVDSLASDWGGEGERRRLIVVSAGNCQNASAWLNHPNHLATEGIHDPAQAWNALTIGAYTEKINITEPDAFDYQPIARSGSLSPFSSTSGSWTNPHLPWKPDVVFEGGNAGRDGAFASSFPSLSLLTSYYQPQQRLFTTTNATSAATALAVNMSARIAAQYPSFWPETIRALIVHSARWTPRMLEEFASVGSRGARRSNLLRHCGYGVPNLERAMWSARNSLTLIVQDSLQPFEKTSKGVKTRDMHIHALPWPRDALEQFGDTDVKLRATLSYFVEPNPGDRGSGNKYVYQSHGLRFEIRRGDETTSNFRARINRLARDEEEGTHTASADQNWEIGDQLRRRGSIHSDVWSGSAAELANRGLIGIYPALGWWRRRQKLERFDRVAKYALIVSIEAPAIPVDLYALVAAQIAAEIEV